MQPTHVPGLRRPRAPGTAILATSLAAFGVTVVAASPASAAPVCTGTTTVTCSFAYNGTTGGDGSAQTWTVPAGVTSAVFTALGAQGGEFSGFGAGGLGGAASGSVALTPGTTITIVVGGAGGTSIAGFNGGGSATFGGGGGSDVRIGGTALANRVLVAGGGGGSSNICILVPVPQPCTRGGAGGGNVGGDGTATPDTATPDGGRGGTQTAGGAGGTGATSGASGVGGDGSSADNGGGGGGGYYGGGGGGINTAGGGGSGFYDPAVVTNGSLDSAARNGNGEVLLQYTTPTTPRVPELEIGNRSGLEGNSGTRVLALPVTLSRAVGVPVTVHWRTINGAARAPGDFVAASGTLTFSPGQTRRNVLITVKGDRFREANETFTVVLNSPTNARIDEGTGRGTILNDD